MTTQLQGVHVTDQLVTAILKWDGVSCCVQQQNKRNSRSFVSGNEISDQGWRAKKWLTQYDLHRNCSRVLSFNGTNPGLVDIKCLQFWSCWYKKKTKKKQAFPGCYTCVCVIVSNQIQALIFLCNWDCVFLLCKCSPALITTMVLQHEW